MTAGGSRGGRLRRRRRLSAFDEDPLSGLANLFDAALVFGTGLLLAALSAASAAGLAASGAQASEALHAEALPLERFRAAERVIGGDGERLGIAYRLSTGEVVYVPESEAEAAVAR